MAVPKRSRAKHSLSEKNYTALTIKQLFWCNYAKFFFYKHFLGTGSRVLWLRLWKEHVRTSFGFMPKEVKFFEVFVGELLMQSPQGWSALHKMMYSSIYHTLHSQLFFSFKLLYLRFTWGCLFLPLEPKDGGVLPVLRDGLWY